MRYRSATASLRIGAVSALEPYVRMIIAPDRTINIKKVLTPPGTARAKSSGETHTPAADQPASAAAAAPPEARSKHKRKAAVQTAAAPACPLTPFPVSIATVTLV